MPTISQLPTAGVVSASDQVPISQGGSVCAVSVGELLISTQPAISVSSPSLIGRTSLGAGGPEQVDVGLGLTLSQGIVAATGADHAAFPPVETLVAGADLVISNRGTPMLMAADLLRGLFSAGNNVTIDINGTIASSVAGTLAATTLLGSAIGALEVVNSLSATDLVPISQSGADHAVAYQDLLNGVTIEQAASAVSVSNSDSLWVAQGSNVMARQTFEAIWQWTIGQLPHYTVPVIELTADSILDSSLHNGCILVCSQPIKLTPSASGLPSGFRCRLVNLSSGDVTFGAGFLTSSGSAVVGSLQIADVQCLTYSAGTILYVAMPPAVTPLSLPGEVVGLGATNITSTSMTLVWQAPAVGGAPASYTVQYRVTGSSIWAFTVASVSTTTCNVQGLQASTSYDFQVQAINASGAGAFSGILTVLTSMASASPTSVPSQVTGLSAVAVSSTSVQVGWLGQSGANAATGFTIQYRVTGTSAWLVSAVGVSGTSYGLTGLQAATQYDFSVVGVNANGLGPVSSTVSLTTPAAVVPVPAGVSGVSGVAASSTSVVLSWSGQTGIGAATSYTVQYRVTGTTVWSSLVPGIVGNSYTVTGLQPGTSYDFSIFGADASGTGPTSSTFSVATSAVGTSVSSITWNVVPGGNYSHGSGAIGVNAHVSPSSAAIQFGFATSATIGPTSWTPGALVNTDLWGAYVPTPATAGTWYVWAEGIDGSCRTVSATSFLVQ